MRAPLLLVALAAGCYQPAVATGMPCATNGACPSGLECRFGTCEDPGISEDAATEDAAIDACPAATCSGDVLIGCGAPVTCATGCSETGGAHCRVLVPSNGLTPAMLTGATADMLGGDWDFNTDTGEIKKGNTSLRAAGTGVIGGIGFQVVDTMGVFTANSFTLGPVDDWSADGSNTFVLFSATTIVAAGDIDVGSSSSDGGPGASNGTSSTSGSGCRGRAGRLFSPGFAEGGGGGGGRTAGGDGGASNQGASAGLGGSQCTTNPTTIPLRGGAGGGYGGGSFSNAGGGGGGAVALVAMESITITSSSAVGSPGGPGGSGPGPSPSGDGGGGGGGGGAVLIEAPFVTISGALTANGGSGAAPFDINGVRGNIESSSSVAGGSYMGVSGGRGGTGGVAPGSGGNYTVTDTLLVVTSSRGAGGGGAAGRTEIKALVRDTSGATLSPGPALTMATLE